ncbi:centrosomal protein of 70 kDa [Gastrophryne carolinensis]
MAAPGADDNTTQAELSEWGGVNRILKRHGCSPVSVRGGLSGGVVLEAQGSAALRSAITSLAEDTERRQNLIHGLIQSNNQLKEDLRLQQERAGRQEQRANELQRLLEDVRAKIRNLEDDFIARMRQQQSEVAAALQEKSAAQERGRKQQEKLQQQEDAMVQLKKRLSQAAGAEEKRATNQKKAFLRLMKREPRDGLILDQQILDVIDGYERQVAQLQNELRTYQSMDHPVRLRKSSDASLDLDATPNYKALLKSYQEQVKEARTRNEQLLREKQEIQQEAQSRPSAREFRLYKQQMRKMEKLLLQNNIRVNGPKQEKNPEGGSGATCTDLQPTHLPPEECQRHLQILCDISAVVSGPRAPQQPLYKYRSLENGADFLHLLPTLELWAGQLLSLKTLDRALKKLSEKLLPEQTPDTTGEGSDGGGVEQLLRLVDTMMEEVENRQQDSGRISVYTLQALVSHFQKLFDVPSLSGVLPRMHEVYTKLGELTNTMRNLRNILELDDMAGAGAVINAVWRLRREPEGGAGGKLGQVLGPLDIDSIINKLQEHEEFFPAFEGLVRDLLEVLGIGQLEQILPEVLRLKRLDQR